MCNVLIYRKKCLKIGAVAVRFRLFFQKVIKLRTVLIKCKIWSMGKVNWGTGYDTLVQDVHTRFLNLGRQKTKQLQIETLCYYI